MIRRPVHNSNAAFVGEYPSRSYEPPRPRGKIVSYPSRNALDVTQFENRQEFLDQLSKHTRRHRQHHLWNFYLEEWRVVERLKKQEEKHQERVDFVNAQENLAIRIADRLDNDPFAVLTGEMSWLALEYVLDLYGVDKDHNEASMFETKHGLKISHPQIHGDVIYEDGRTVKYVFWKPGKPDHTKPFVPYTDTHKTLRNTEWMKLYGDNQLEAIVTQLKTNESANPAGIVDNDTFETALRKLGVKTSHKTSTVEQNKILGYSISHPDYVGEVRYTNNGSDIAYTIWRRRPELPPTPSYTPKPKETETEIRQRNLRRSWISDADSRLTLQCVNHPTIVEDDYRIDRAYTCLSTIQGLGYERDDRVLEDALIRRFEGLLQGFVDDLPTPTRPAPSPIPKKVKKKAVKVHTPEPLLQEAEEEEARTPHRKEGNGKRSRRKREKSERRAKKRKRSQKDPQRAVERKERRNNRQQLNNDF